MRIATFNKMMRGGEGEEREVAYALPLSTSHNSITDKQSHIEIPMNSLWNMRIATCNESKVSQGYNSPDKALHNLERRSNITKLFGTLTLGILQQEQTSFQMQYSRIRSGVSAKLGIPMNPQNPAIGLQTVKNIIEKGFKGLGYPLFFFFSQSRTQRQDRKPLWKIDRWDIVYIPWHLAERS
jgi:hypothetical protein